MKYLCLAYYDEEKFEALSPDALAALVGQCPARDAELRATGRLLMAASLGSPREGAVLRPRGGRPAVTDGPYTEAKELVGGFVIIEAASREEAIAIASLHPAAQLGEAVGWGIELRPIEHYESSAS